MNGISVSTPDIKDTLLLRLEILVRVRPKKLRPYSTIADLPTDEMAARLVSERCLEGLQWMDGFERLEATRTYIVVEGER